MSTKTENVIVVGSNDFGFTIEDIPIDNSATDDLQQRLDTVIEMINVLLDNLAKNPNVATISWPNRGAKIKEFKEKLLAASLGK